jgi:hypothetical protein
MTADTSACRYIRQWIRHLKRRLAIAIKVDEFLKLLNDYLQEFGYGKLEEVTEDELKQCLRHVAVEIIVKDGKEVVWLWGGRLRHRLFDRIIEMAAKNGEVSVA